MSRVSSAVFCLVYGLSNAAAHSWRTPSTYGFLAVGVVLLVAFALWQGRAPSPLLPPRVVLDRNRGGAYLSLLIGTAGLFGILLFLTCYLQQTLGYSPLATGFAFLGMSAGLIVMANLSTVALMPRFGPKPPTPAPSAWPRRTASRWISGLSWTDRSWFGAVAERLGPPN